MKITMKHIPEPQLLFGAGVLNVDPRVGLEQGGLLSVVGQGPPPISLGLVCPRAETDLVLKWFRRLDSWMIDSETNALRFPKFPGLKRTIRRTFAFEKPRNIREIDESAIEGALARGAQAKFDAVLEIYATKVKSLFRDHGPSVIVVALPEEVATMRIANARLSFKERRLLERVQEDTVSKQMELFDEFSEEERRTARELLPQADELLFRSFHRALKARCMQDHGAVPIQIIRRHTYVPEDSNKQNDATKAWNMSVALAYKAGEIPWQPTGLLRDTCFIGVSFHHLKRRGGDLVYASLAQAYSTDTEPYAIQGASIPHDQKINRQPYLKAEDADGIVRRVLAHHEEVAGVVPARLVVHKSSTFLDPEIEGFRRCLSDGVAQVDLVSLKATGLRLLTKTSTEVPRGSLVQIEGKRTFLFTSGYVEWWKSYPGPHIPAPLELKTAGGEDIERCAAEILALTKMNWNSAEGLGRTPITLAFARQVGIVMTEMKEDEKVNPFFRFYM